MMHIHVPSHVDEIFIEYRHTEWHDIMNLSKYFESETALVHAKLCGGFWKVEWRWRSRPYKNNYRIICSPDLNYCIEGYHRLLGVDHIAFDEPQWNFLKDDELLMFKKNSTWFCRIYSDRGSDLRLWYSSCSLETVLEEIDNDD